MKRKEFNRVIRSRKLSPQEAARDEGVRKKIVAEFPPAKKDPGNAKS